MTRDTSDPNAVVPVHPTCQQETYSKLLVKYSLHKYERTCIGQAIMASQKNILPVAITLQYNFDSF